MSLKYGKEAHVRLLNEVKPNYSFSRSVMIFAVCTCFALPGCKSSDVIWSKKISFPDGKMIASARTIAQSGFGTGYVGTTVYLNWSQGSQPPMEILGLSGGTEVPGTTDVMIRWADSNHLELAYKGSRNLYFQAARCNGVDISVHNFL